MDKVSTRGTQKEIDEGIDKERERNARTIDVTDRAVQDKDQIVLDFEGFVDGEAFEGGKAENYSLTVGSGSSSIFAISAKLYSSKNLRVMQVLSRSFNISRAS